MIYRVLNAVAFEEAALFEACSWFSLVARSKSSELVRGAGIILVHPNRVAKRKEIIAEMDKLNGRPVTSPEFLALLKAHPDLQRKFPLVGLGSVWVGSDGDRHVLFADEDSDERDLRLGWDDGGWGERCRFPAVCPTSPAGFAG